MSTVTVSLINLKHAPWGLLTDDENPEKILWLTDLDPSASVDSVMLTDWDIVRIRQSEAALIVKTEGLDEITKIGVPDKVKSTCAIPIVSPVDPKIVGSDTIMDVTQLLRQQAERAKILEEKIRGSYPKIDELLVLPANKLKKELKELAKTQTSVSFFQECRKKEVKQKDRKTVVAVLVEIIQAKINVVGLDGRANGYTGQTVLSDAYYDMIEEFEDEDENE